MRHPTPEEAARGDIPARYVEVVAVVVRGDRAIVVQLTNDRPPHETDTVHCTRNPDGSWEAGVCGGNSWGGFLSAGDGVGTLLAWRQAPAGAVAARFACQGRELTVPVERGRAVAVFDDVVLDGAIEPMASARWLRERRRARVAAALTAAWLRMRPRRLSGARD